MHIFLKAYLSFRGKIFKLYTFSCSPHTSLPKIKKKKSIYVLVTIFFHPYTCICFKDQLIKNPMMMMEKVVCNSPVLKMAFLRQNFGN